MRKRKTNTNDSVWKLLRDAFRGDPIRKQEERVELAVENANELRADAKFYSMMQGHYVKLASLIDPKQNWWGYANAMEKATRFGEQFREVTEDAQNALAIVDAEQARLVQLLDGPASTGKGDTP